MVLGCAGVGTPRKNDLEIALAAFYQGVVINAGEIRI